MKELTIEQKAKAYDKALERARKLKENPQGVFYEYSPDEGDTICDYIFPELKESEDENKLKHSLMQYLWDIYHKDFCPPKPSIELCDKWLAWLEKQDGLKSDEWKEGDVVRHGGILALVTNGRRAIKSNREQITIQYPNEWVKANSNERKCFFDVLEKQGEQKLTIPKWKHKNDNTPLLRDSIILNKYGRVAKSPSGAIVSDVWVLDYDELAKLPKEEFEKQDEQLYIRFGEIPTDGKSKIFHGDIEIGTENGVSVYPAFETNNGDIVLGLNLPITKTTLHTQQHLLEYDNRPCYLVKGNYVGKDTDGQPLIDNVNIIRKIDSYRIKEEKADNENYVKLAEKQCEQKPITEMLSPEESLGISSDEYNEIVNECLYGKSKLADKVEPKFKIGDVVRLKYGDGLEWLVKEKHEDGNYTIACADRDDCVLLDDKWELVKQKSAEWSEEDERHLNSILERIEGKPFILTRFTVNQDVDWLKLLKQKIKNKL